MPRFHLVLTHYRPKQTPWKHFQEVQKSNTGLQWVKMEDLTPVNNKVRKNLENYRPTTILPNLSKKLWKICSDSNHFFQKTSSVKIPVWFSERPDLSAIAFDHVSKIEMSRRRRESFSYTVNRIIMGCLDHDNSIGSIHLLLIRSWIDNFGNVSIICHFRQNIFQLKKCIIGSNYH